MVKKWLEGTASRGDPLLLGERMERGIGEIKEGGRIKRRENGKRE